MSIYLLQVINGIGIGMLYFLLAVGLSIVFGLLRFVNFAHGASTCWARTSATR